MHLVQKTSASHTEACFMRAHYAKQAVGTLDLHELSQETWPPHGAAAARLPWARPPHGRLCGVCAEPLT